jgi:hypothetical protein
MLMDPDVCRVDEDVFEIGIIRQGFENALPHALLRPTPKAGVDGEPFAEFFRQIAPGRAGPCDPQNRLDKQPIVMRGGPRITLLARQFWRNPVPLLLVQNRANQGSPPFFSLESELCGLGNRSRRDECKQA